MRILLSIALASATLIGAPALAGGETMTQPAQNDVTIRAYPTKANFCPTGLQPVVFGGVISCGRPSPAGNPGDAGQKRTTPH